MARSQFWPRCKAMIEVVFDGRGAPNSKAFHLEVDPRSADVGLNGFYEADTFNLEFDARVLPFDPDQVAYAAVRIYMWDSQKNLEDGEWAVEENEMIRGLVDDVESNLVGADTIVKFIGRDYTALLADAEWDPKEKVAAGEELNDIVQDIADKAAPPGTTARFQVIWEGEDNPVKVGGLMRGTKKKGLWVKPGKSYWDVIWDLCVQHAFVPRIVTRDNQPTIVISEPITQTKQSLNDAPKLIWGQNLDELSIKRKFSREKVPQIVIRAWDPNTKKEIEVRYPAKKNISITGKDALGTPLTAKKDEEMFFPAPAGVFDKKALLRQARNRFYHLGRGETTYTMKTSSLIVESDDGHEYNALRLRPGYAVGVRFDPFNQTLLRTMKDPGKRIEYIVSQGYGTEVATFIANNFENLELFHQAYYFNRGQVSYHIEEGIEMEIEAVNFSYAVREIHFAENATEAA